MKFIYHPLIFKQPSGTSRGILTQKDTWFITDERGIMAEVSRLDGLSLESYPDVETELRQMTRTNSIPSRIDLSSIRFAQECLQTTLDTHQPFLMHDGPFYRGEKGIPINGLIWMGAKDFMKKQIAQKLSLGFRCIKLKIGALDFNTELSLLHTIRSQYTADDVEIRVDANGAFAPTEALEKLKKLSDYHIHSIEQPIAASQWEHMALLCEKSPVAIALDEELIPIREINTKSKLLDTINPQYLILKPSLIGGFAHTDEWIKLAQERHIGWWATSALESNIGLNAIAQWISRKETSMPQGLGTGQLFTNNIDSPLTLKDAALWYDHNKLWHLPKV